MRRRTVCRSPERGGSEIIVAPISVFVIVVIVLPAGAHPLDIGLTSFPIDQTIRNLVQELAGKHCIGLPPLASRGGAGHIEAALRTSDTHICQTTFLGQFSGVLHGTLVREGTLLHTGEEHVRVFQSLRCVQSHHRDLAGILVLPRQLVGIGDQRRSLQETGQCGVRCVLLEFGGHGLQL